MERFVVMKREREAQRQTKLQTIYLTIHPGALPEELDQLNQADLASDQLLQLAVTRGMDGLKAELGAFLQRRDSMLRIEKRVTELAALFADFEALIREQARPVQNIALYCADAREFLEASTAHMTQSVEYARKSRWWWPRCSIF